MTPSPPIPIHQSLRKLFSTAFLIQLASRTGAARRVRQINIVDLFWTLVLGFGMGRERTLAGLRRAYEKTTGQTVEESSFYKRFNVGLVAMLKAASVHALDASAGLGRALRGPLASFRDGYFSYRLFACIDQNGGYFLTCLKRSANPTILRVKSVHHHYCCGQAHRGGPSKDLCLAVAD